MAGRIPPPTILGHELAWDPDELDTDPDVFGPKPAQTGDDQITQPRCMTCGRAMNEITSFDKGIIYALNGVYWMLCKRMPVDEATAITMWLREGIEP